jgi:SAM-dependent methyltransferase
VLWRVKIGAKLVLSRLPLAYRIWQRLGLFRHGAMDTAGYASHVFNHHYARKRSPSTGGFVALELGPGDSLASALLARCHGADRTYLIDAGDFASKDMTVYAALAMALRSSGIEVPPELDFDSYDAFLDTCRITYLTRGLASLRAVPDASANLQWSHAVLEHVPRSDFAQTMSELNRILAPDGVSSHVVDLKDHLGGALNNLRFSDRTWESHLFRNSGFYTNRIRYSEMMQAFALAGFDSTVVRKSLWEKLPTPARRLARPFRSMATEELRVKGFDVVLTKSSPPSVEAT